MEGRTGNFNKDRFGSYHDDQEIKPAPCIGKVCLESIGDPFEQHFQHEDNREKFVDVRQPFLEPFPIF